MLSQMLRSMMTRAIRAVSTLMADAAAFAFDATLPDRADAAPLDIIFARHYRRHLIYTLAFLPYRLQR